MGAAAHHGALSRSSHRAKRAPDHAPDTIHHTCNPSVHDFSISFYRTHGSAGSVAPGCGLARAEIKYPGQHHRPSTRLCTQHGHHVQPKIVAAAAHGWKSARARTCAAELGEYGRLGSSRHALRSHSTHGLHQRMSVRIRGRTRTSEAEVLHQRPSSCIRGRTRTLEAELLHQRPSSCIRGRAPA